MNCPEESVLVAFINCDLSNEDFEKLEEHLTECSSCRQKISELEKNLVPCFELSSSMPSIVSGENTARERVESMLENGTFLHLPQQIGPYLLTERLGQGGMGVVYAAEHQILHRKFAVKFIRPKFLLNSSSLERFQKEILAAGKLVHPNIVSATDAGVFENFPFLVMEFLPGESLTSYVKRKGGKLPLQEALNILSQAAFGLEFAHSVGLIHFDVKPSNLWRLPDGTIKVMDLGLAHASEELEDISTHPVLGTPNFMAPEQSVPHAKIDAKADIYALGCVFFYLLTGMTQNDCICKEIEFPNLREAGVSVPKKIQNFLNLATKTSPSKRISSMREVCLTLAEFRKPFWKKSNFRLKVAGGILGLLGLGLLLTVAFRSPKDLDENKVSVNLESQNLEQELTDEVSAEPTDDDSSEQPAEEDSTETEKTDEDAHFEKYVGKIDEVQQYQEAINRQRKEYEEMLATPIDRHDYFPYCDVPKLPMENSSDIPEIDWSSVRSDSTFNYFSTNQNQLKAAEELEDAKELEKQILGNLKLEELNESYREELAQRFSEVADHYKKAIKLGSKDAVAGLWELYWGQFYKPEDPEDLYKQLQDAAREGSIPAIHALGLEYWFGKYHERDPEKAVQWFMNAVNSNQRSSDVHDCLFCLGQAYDSGEGVPQSHKNALICYECAITSGNAICEVGISFLKGNGYKKDEKKAFQLFVQNGPQCPKKLYLAAYCLEHKIGLPKEVSAKKSELKKLALDLFQSAIIQNKIFVFLGYNSELTPDFLEQFPSKLYYQAEEHNELETENGD